MNLVTLVDGRQVDSSSEEWHAECEARFLLSLPLIERRRGMPRQSRQIKRKEEREAMRDCMSLPDNG